jgi:hypothetical protein
MKTYLCMMRVVLVVPATIVVCANRMLRHWPMMDDMGRGIMMWVYPPDHRDFNGLHALLEVS